MLRSEEAVFVGSKSRSNLDVWDAPVTKENPWCQLLIRYPLCFPSGIADLLP